MAIKIITDSTCDIDINKQNELDIEIIPLLVRFGEKEYKDGIDISRSEFYKMLRNSEVLPTTAQINPNRFYEVFKKYVDNGDDIVCVFISGRMSGTCQSAAIARDMLNAENIYIVDSRNVTLGLSLMVYEAIELRKKGLTAVEMFHELERLVKKVKLLAMVDTLEYLRKGGRLSSTAAFIGSVFNIKPIITAKEGLIAVAGKERGQKAAMKFIANKMLIEKPESGHKMVIGHSDSPNLMENLKIILSEAVNIKNSEEVELGPVVGVHAGPGCAGLAYITEIEQNN